MPRRTSQPVAARESRAVVAEMERQIKRMNNEIEAAHDVIEKLEATRDQAKAYLASKQLDYAKLHFEGAQVAAGKGDTRPAEWALTHVKADTGGTVVDPPAKQAADTGVKVFLGIKIGGVPEDAVTAEAILLGDEPNTPSRAYNE